MANIRSALKRARQTKTRTARNKVLRTRVKSSRKALLQALEARDSQAVATRYRDFISAADKAAKANVIHRNSSSRLKRIFSSRVAALSYS